MPRSVSRDRLHHDRLPGTGYGPASEIRILSFLSSTIHPARQKKTAGGDRSGDNLDPTGGVLGVTLLLFSRYFALRPTRARYRHLGLRLALLHAGQIFHSAAEHLGFLTVTVISEGLVFCSVAGHLWPPISGSHLLYGGRSFLCRSSVSFSSSPALCGRGGYLKLPNVASSPPQTACPSPASTSSCPSRPLPGSS